MGVVPENACLPQEIEASEADFQKTGDSKIDSASGARKANAPLSYEELLKEYNQLRERSSRTTNALGSAAHDLKTPLSILNGYIELLQNEKLGPLNDRQREILGDMHASGQRLQYFIQDFLSYTVLETGEMKMRYEVGNVNPCLSEVCRLWANRFQERGLALYFLANEKLPEFSFDSAKLQRVISNLLENASKFTPTGGTVWLHAEPYMWERRNPNSLGMPDERRRQNEPLPNSVKVSVSDTGPGIPADQLNRLLQREGWHPGSALALLLVEHIAVAHGGGVRIESRTDALDHFTSICLTIPIR